MQSKKEADAAGRMLHEMRRPPTWEEVKSEIPRGPEVDPDLIEAPSYRDMTQEEALDLVRRGGVCVCVFLIAICWQVGFSGRFPDHGKPDTIMEKLSVSSVAMQVLLWIFRDSMVEHLFTKQQKRPSRS